MRDRRKDRETNALTSVRTVHSRAFTSLAELERGNWRMNGEYSYDDRNNGLISMQDEDYDEMREALEKVVELLQPWAKK